MIRISGADAQAAVAALSGRLPPPRRASLRALRSGDLLLDRALVILFPKPDSATGEDLVELHCHGGRAVVEAVETALCEQPGVRAAEPGEFTRRALANGRIDLAQAEGLADLLEAETETQRRAALAAAEGQVSRLVRSWMTRLADLSARIEASLDYAEEGDVTAEETAIDEVRAGQRRLADEIAAVLATPPVERWRNGIRVAIAGPPNAGKSTLLNALAEIDAAIVSPVAGTTRDRIEVPVRRDGIAYVLIDTAGLHEASVDPIERIGIERAREAIATADLTLWLGEAPSDATNHIVVQAKADLPGREQLLPGAAIAVSGYRRDGIDQLWAMIAFRTEQSIDLAVPLTDRIWQSCRDALAAIRSTSTDVLILGEQLRRGRASLAQALGLDATEVMLDALFSRFCLGK